jgi:hypothetical protein
MRISQWLWPPDIVSTSRTMFHPSDGRSTMKHEFAACGRSGSSSVRATSNANFGAAGARDEPLVAVDHPLVAVLVRVTS